LTPHYVHFVSCRIICVYHLLSQFVYISVCVLSTVESYTREAGVRTLERRIGAVCRAVAVKIAEHLRKLNANEPSASTSAADEEVSMKDRKQQLEMSETVDILNVSNMTIPPKLPIVIDMAAIEDILGVRICCSS